MLGQVAAGTSNAREIVRRDQCTTLRDTREAVNVLACIGSRCLSFQHRITQTAYALTSCRKLLDSDLTRSQLESVIATQQKQSPTDRWGATGKQSMPTAATWMPSQKRPVCR